MEGAKLHNDGKETFLHQESTDDDGSEFPDIQKSLITVIGTVTVNDDKTFIVLIINTGFCTQVITPKKKRDIVKCFLFLSILQQISDDYALIMLVEMDL